MALAIYKPGQGYWTRVMSAIGAATLVLTGVGWLWAQFQMWFSGSENLIYYQGGMAVGMIVFFGALLYWLLNKPRIADFMIATEAEMKKVNWPTRREVIGSTWIVICGAMLMAGWLWVFNLVFGWFFLQIDILEG
ncbi:preprotein translocase subunit SecE [Phycisphaerales bacterium AB-hyl4]|uniref:Protein translocase subunit SecE n=1 Tax=Natronomicrosphaera hydrolytica TaxID=3242702 RepID=A0ABV4U397_9BACT